MGLIAVGHRGAALLVLAVSFGIVGATPASAQSSQSSSDEQALLERFAPVIAHFYEELAPSSS